MISALALLALTLVLAAVCAFLLVGLCHQRRDLRQRIERRLAASIQPPEELRRRLIELRTAARAMKQFHSACPHKRRVA